MIRRTALFSGRVQGVGFRYTTCRIAEGFAVTGYVRNLADGRVEAVVEGERDEVEAFLKTVGQELNSFIRDTSVQDAPGDGRFREFTIRA